MSCLKCGACCRVLRFEVARTDAQEEFFQARGLLYQVHGDRVAVDVPHVCPQLRGNLCGADKKPLVCRMFPADGQEPLEGCGYE